MVLTSDKKTPSITFRCINCGRKWGEGPDILSYGLCIECFADWAKTKKECFGTSNVLINENKCNLHKFCKEYYGFKQNLPR